jgi:hypothetical protein
VIGASIEGRYHGTVGANEQDRLSMSGAVGRDRGTSGSPVPAMASR